jgi:hypothetical protein
LRSSAEPQRPERGDTLGGRSDELAGLTIAADDARVDEDVAVPDDTIVVRKYSWTSTETPPLPPRDALDVRQRGRVALWAALGGGEVAGLELAPPDYRVRDDVELPDDTIVVRRYRWTSPAEPPRRPRDNMDARYVDRVATWAARRKLSTLATRCRGLLVAYSLRRRLATLGRLFVRPARRPPRRAGGNRARAPGRRTDDDDLSAPGAAS